MHIYIQLWPLRLIVSLLVVILFFSIRIFCQKFNFIGWTSCNSHENENKPKCIVFCGQISILVMRWHTHTRAMQHYNLYSCSLLLVMLNTWDPFHLFLYIYSNIRLLANICQLLHILFYSSLSLLFYSVCPSHSVSLFNVYIEDEIKEKRMPKYFTSGTAKCTFMLKIFRRL